MNAKVKTTTREQDDEAYTNPGQPPGTVLICIRRANDTPKEVELFSYPSKLIKISEFAKSKLNPEPGEDDSGTPKKKPKPVILLPSHLDPDAVRSVLRYIEVSDRKVARKKGRKKGRREGLKLSNGYCGDGTRDPTFAQVMNLYCAAEALGLRKEYVDDRIRDCLPEDKSKPNDKPNPDNGMRLTCDDFIAAINGEKTDKRIARMMKAEVVWCEKIKDIDEEELRKIDEWCEANVLADEMAYLRADAGTKGRAKKAEAELDVASEQKPAADWEQEATAGRKQEPATEWEEEPAADWVQGSGDEPSSSRW